MEKAPRQPASTAPDLVQGCGGRQIVEEGNREHASSPGLDLGRADDAIDRPIAALDQHIGPCEQDQIQWCVVLELGNQIDTRECS